MKGSKRVRIVYQNNHQKVERSLSNFIFEGEAIRGADYGESREKEGKKIGYRSQEREERKITQVNGGSFRIKFVVPRRPNSVFRYSSLIMVYRKKLFHLLFRYSILCLTF
jgi:hypothetical protein